MSKTHVTVPESVQWAFAGFLAIGVLGVGFGLGRLSAPVEVEVRHASIACLASSQRASARLGHEAEADRLTYAWVTDPEKTARETGLLTGAEVSAELARLAQEAATAGYEQHEFENQCQEDIP